MRHLAASKHPFKPHFDKGDTLTQMGYTIGAATLNAAEFDLPPGIAAPFA